MHDDVDDEIAAHLEEHRDELAARGMPREEAARAAAAKFGDRGAIADVCRRIDRAAHHGERRRHMVADLRQDVGYALRLLRRNPGFTGIAVLTLALGMGATTTIFTLANWALIRPVPGVTNPADVSVFWVGRRNSDQSFSPWRLSYPNLADALPRLKTVSLGAYQGGGLIPVAGGGQAAQNIATEHVTAGYFSVLGVRMQLGRPFTADEDTPPMPVLGAVISDRLWTSMFQRDPNVLRQALDVAGVRFSILGVAAPGFHGTERLSTTDLWLPGASTPIVRHRPALRYDARANVSGGFYELIARLTPGATWPQAEAEMESLRAWLLETYPTENEQFRATGFHLMGPIGPSPLGRELLTKLVGFTAAPASALLMLIACANVAGLLMMRGVTRRSEVGVRKALGASRWRLVRQHLVEGLVLWLLGGAAALALMFVLRQTLDLPALIGMATRDMVPTVDWRVLTFTGIVSLTVGTVFSGVPAMRATRVDPADMLRSATAGSTRRMFAGTSLAVLQLGASMTLLVGAFLMVGTLRHLAAVPLGFDSDGLFLTTVRPGSLGYGAARSREYVAEFQRRLRQVPGVRSTAAATGAPFAWSSSTLVRRTDAAPSARSFSVGSLRMFDASYFATVGIPLLAGRLLTDADFGDTPRARGAVVLSEGAARRLFGPSEAVGREVTFPVFGQQGTRYEVVGVVGTARYRTLVRDPEDIAYEVADARDATGDVTLAIRAAESVRLADEARRIAAGLNASLPLTRVVSMTDTIARVRREWDSLARLLGVLAAVAAVLACVGLYGVVAHGVAQRRREFGIRAALGASSGDVWRLVLRQSATIVGAGVAVGLLGAYAFAQVLSSRLVGVTAHDPALWSLAAGSLIAVALVASLKPALAASRIDVGETLRAL